MKLGRILAISIIILVLASTLGCSAQSTTNQQSTVTRGDLTVTVSGSGKSSYAVDADLVFGSTGKIEKIAVKEGDRVTKGSMLAKLETDALELALSSSQVSQAQAQAALTQVQSARTQAEVALTAAQFNLDRIEAVSDIMDDIDNTNAKKQQAQLMVQEASRSNDADGTKYWKKQLSSLDNDTLSYQNDLATLLAKDQYAGEFLYISGQRYDRLVIEDARIKQLQVTAAQQEVQLAEQNIEQAKRSLNQADKAVALAQKQLKDATLIAPFDGVIAALDIKEGDIFGASSGVPIQMIAPDSLELNIEVDEIDVAQTQVSQKAIIRLDAMPDTKLDGKVISISTLPIAKPQNSGVVVYEVKVSFAGVIPASVKSGMSATVDIVTAEKKSVLLAPNKSIKRDSKGKTSVNVLIDQKAQERPVVTGSTDGTQTEIISGLNEGDIVVLNTL